MKTPKQVLWQQYYAAIKAGKTAEAESILKKIHAPTNNHAPRAGRCGACRKRF